MIDLTLFLVWWGLLGFAVGIAFGLFCEAGRGDDH